MQSLDPFSRDQIFYGEPHYLQLQNLLPPLTTASPYPCPALRTSQKNKRWPCFSTFSGSFCAPVAPDGQSISTVTRILTDHVVIGNEIRFFLGRYSHLSADMCRYAWCGLQTV